MKKRKPPENLPSEFHHSPFKSLKAFVPQQTRQTTSPSPARKKNEQPEDDDALFLRAVSGVRKIAEGAGAPLPEKSSVQTKQQGATDKEDEQVFLQAMQKIGTTFREVQGDDEEETGSGHRSPSSRLRQLKRGTIRIGGELDLHGYLRDEALVRLRRFVTDAASRGQQAVLVITGKGINSPQGPVLRGAVADWLRANSRELVAEFSPAPGNLGGSGAYVVFLKKK